MSQIMGNLQMGYHFNVAVVKNKGDDPAIVAMISSFQSSENYGANPVYVIGSFAPVDFARGQYSINLTLTGFVRYRDNVQSLDDGTQGLSEFKVDVSKLSETDEAYPEGYFYQILVINKEGKVTETYENCVITTLSSNLSPQSQNVLTVGLLAVKRVS